MHFAASSSHYTCTMSGSDASKFTLHLSCRVFVSSQVCSESLLLLILLLKPRFINNEAGSHEYEEGNGGCLIEHACHWLLQPKMV